MGGISVIIPQHGKCDLTVDAIRTLRRFHALDMEILVVDDGSSSKERHQLQRNFSKEITILPMPRRQGVTAAWNEGARSAGGEFLIFLNNDTVTTGSWISNLVAPVVSGFGQVSGVTWRREADCPEHLRDRSEQGTVLEGWCLALRSETWRSLGGFDERFRTYYSDTDLQCRILAGQRESCPLQAVTNLPIHHLGHRTAHALPDRLDEWRSDRRKFRDKWDWRGNNASRPGV